MMAILGYAQLLQRRITRSPNLAPSEREAFLQEIAVIDEAARALQHDLVARPSPRAERDGARDVT